MVEEGVRRFRARAARQRVNREPRRPFTRALVERPRNGRARLVFLAGHVRNYRSAASVVFEARALGAALGCSCRSSLSTVADATRACPLLGSKRPDLPSVRARHPSWTIRRPSKRVMHPTKCIRGTERVILTARAMPTMTPKRASGLRGLSWRTRGSPHRLSSLEHCAWVALGGVSRQRLVGVVSRVSPGR